MGKFWNRVDFLRESQGMTQARLAKKLNKSSRTVEDWKKRKYVPTGDVCVSIAKLFDTSVEFLITGDELSLKDDSFIVGEPLDSVYTVKGPVELLDDEEATIVVPIVPQVLSAGLGEEFLEGSYESVGRVRILERMARGIDHASLVAAIVKGDSMTGVQIFSGDVVIFARGHIDENGIYVISLYGEVKVKRLEFRAGDQMIFIHSENNRYSVEEIPMTNDNLVILGKVVGWVHCHPY